MLDLSLARDDFQTLAAEILSAGNTLRFRARGSSMHPFIRDGDVLEVAPVLPGAIQRGAVVLCHTGDDRLVAHRVVRVQRAGGRVALWIRGDALACADGLVPGEEVLGQVVALDRRGRLIPLESGVQRLLGLLWAGLVPHGGRLCHALAALKRALRPAV